MGDLFTVGFCLVIVLANVYSLLRLEQVKRNFDVKKDPSNSALNSQRNFGLSGMGAVVLIHIRA